MALIQKKVAIVLSGGGMTCVYQVGALQALREKFSVMPDIMIGSSGGAGTVAYFAAGQFEAIKHIWLELLSTDKFISFWRIRKIMDIDYLIDVIFKKEVPLDVLRLTETKIKYFIAATKTKTGLVEWFTNGAEEYIFEILRASKAVPVAYNKKINIGRDRYIDGYIGTTFHGSIRKAEDAGAEIVIAINNSTKISLTRSVAFTVYGFFNPPLRKTISQYLNGIKTQQMYTGTKTPVIVLSPSKKLPLIHAFDNNQEKLTASFLQGYNDTINNKELEYLLR